jgi:hypothetical protein
MRRLIVPSTTLRIDMRPDAGIARASPLMWPGLVCDYTDVIDEGWGAL